jgi:lipoprotein-anchoring transpeptidase ErfK/SrfK
MSAVPRRRSLTALAGSARAAVAVALLGAGTLAGSLGLVLSSGGAPAASGPASAATSGALTRPAAKLERPRATPPAGAAAIVRSTELATVRATAPRFDSPGKLAAGTVPASWYQRPSVLPVVATRPGWVEVRLAQRPNQSTAWLPASDVTLSSTPYEIVVDTATTRLSLYDDGQLVFSAPAGVGTAGDPTPAGHYFVAFDEPPPPGVPGYGPFIVVTSAHSPAISDWEGSGDAVIGIHGPLGEDSQIGASGAKISHGCIRLHDQALERLSGVPAGTPIDVVG